MCSCSMQVTFLQALGIRKKVVEIMTHLDACHGDIVFKSALKPPFRDTMSQAFLGCGS